VADETVQIEISAVPELGPLAQEVADTGKRYVLTENGVAIAVVSPAGAKRRRRRIKPLTEHDPIWEIVGIVKEDVGNDVSSNKHRYLGEAYASESE
jgi:hypothetical protein